MSDNFEKIYNDLMHCYYYNKVAKMNYANKKYYSDKHKIIMNCIELISSTKIKNIKIRLSKDKQKPNFIIIHFYFLDKRANFKSVSFHIPDYYKKIILQKIK